MQAIDYNELRNAFEFVSSSSPHEHSAYICLDSGKIYWLSNTIDLEEELPDNIETSNRYLAIPHKNDLKLGQNVALSFVEQMLPNDYNTVASYFRKRGAYRRYKELLQAQGLLENWHKFEADASNTALLAWCKENEMSLIDAPPVLSQIN